MSATTPHSEQLETRQRLLETAAAVFADEGFRGTTVREICRRAGTNVASINYHFRDKEQLYLAVLHFALEGALKKYPPDLGLLPDANPQERLRAYIQSFMLRIFDRDCKACHGKLMAREMIEPTNALDEMVETVMRPLADRLFAIMGDLLGPGATRQEIRFAGASVVSQCVYYQHCHAAVTRLIPEQQFQADDIRQIADHITRFSLGALETMAAEIARQGIADCGLQIADCK